jgi:hypothetical protein
MANFNFLSGSSIDTFPNMLFNILESEECYLGFAKGSPKNQWGINALIQIEHNAPSYLNSIAMSGSGTAASLFYDNNSVALTNAGVDKQTVYIVKYSVADTFFNTPVIMDTLGSLTLSYINQSWVAIQGLANNYYDLMPLDDGHVYYVQNWNNTNSIRLKIKNKLFYSVPFYSESCDLYCQATSASPFVKIAANLQKTSNILGETFTTGMLDPYSILDTDIGSLLNMGINSVVNKAILQKAKFKLVSTSSSGNTLIDNMAFVNPDFGTDQIYTEVSSYETSQKYITLSYPYVDNKLQYMKLVVGANNINSLAIWQEALPYNSIIPVADSNPPALDISYLKNSSIHTSVFDVNGFSKVKIADITYVKEMNNTTETIAASASGFTISTIQLVGEDISHTGIMRLSITASGSPTNIILLQDFHTFVVGDKIFIPYKPQTVTTVGKTYVVANVDYTPSESNITLDSNISLDETLIQFTSLSSEPNNVNANITLATTTDKDKALANGFYNVMITKTIPKSGVGSPTDNVYRQLFITWKPKDSTGTKCTNDLYNGDTTLCGVNFNINNWKYDNGLLIYLSNKLPVYRKWASSDEQFQIIL